MVWRHLMLFGASSCASVPAGQCTFNRLRPDNHVVTLVSTFLDSLAQSMPPASHRGVSRIA